jgi:glutathione S-transferase
MQIIGTTSSPYTRKVRVCALEKGIAHEFVVASPMTGSAAVQAANPLGKVPVLVRADGSRLIDSPLIAAYVDGLSPVPRLIPADGAQHEATQQIEAIADGILDAAILVRVETLRPAVQRNEEWVSWQLGKVHRGLAHLDALLHGRELFVGNELTLGDIAVACCVGYLEFRLADGEWGVRYPKLAAHLDELEARESFAATTFA